MLKGNGGSKRTFFLHALHTHTAMNGIGKNKKLLSLLELTQIKMPYPSYIIDCVKFLRAGNNNQGQHLDDN